MSPENASSVEQAELQVGLCVRVCVFCVCVCVLCARVCER